MTVRQESMHRASKWTTIGLVTTSLFIVVGGCRGSSLEDRDDEAVMDPVTDEVLDREEGEGTGLRKAERNIMLPRVKARVVLEPTRGNDVRGELEIGPAEAGVQIVGSVVGLKPGGIHAMHIHEKGDCSAPDAESAGEHFNPTDQPHGRAHHGAHHVGDMDNLRANNDGEAAVERLARGATLGDGGSNDVAGRAIIVHAQADDYVSQPAGKAGDRIACGVIEIVKSER
jgi:superoxide dismutase, Cu-Zn family